MRIFQIFYLPDIFFSEYGHRHISGSLNFIKNYFPYCFGQAILIYGNLLKGQQYRIFLSY